MNLRFISNLLRNVWMYILINATSITYCYSSIIEDQKIAFTDGQWEKTTLEKTLLECPFTARINGGNIIIENSSPEYDLSIFITNIQTNEVVYETNIHRINSSYIVISVNNLEEGMYSLKITNNSMGWIMGYFNI